MENDKEVPIEFPASGLNVATSYGQQPQGSTPTGVNVRAYESILQRGRGGSRSGLSKYPPGILPSGDNVVQHMNVVVDPQGGALLAGSPLFGLYEEDPDPRWTRFIRIGGDGIQLNQNVSRTVQSPLRQQALGIFSGSDPSWQFNFDSQPTTGNLLVVAIVSLTANQQNFPQSDTGPIHVGGLQNGGANAYTQVGGGGYFADNTFFTAGSPSYTDYYSLSLWYRYASAGANETTVNLTSPGPGGVFASDGVQLFAYEFIGFTGAPVGQAQVSSSGDATPWTLGPLLLSNTPNALVLASFTGTQATYGPPGIGPPSTPSGFTTTGYSPTPSVYGAGFVGYRQLQATTVTVNSTPTASSAYVGMMTSFNHT